MQHDLHNLEQVLLGRLKETYESGGYEFLIEPPQDVLPTFLRGQRYRPDAIALRGEGGIVIEVKVSKASHASPTLARISELVRSNPGWDFKVYYIADETEMGREALRPADLSVLQSGRNEARELWRLGHQRAALLLIWSVFEAALRRALAQAGIAISRKPTQNLLEEAAMNGLIAVRSASHIRHVMKVRSYISHGEFSVDVTEQDFKAISDALDELLEP